MRILTFIREILVSPAFCTSILYTHLLHRMIKNYFWKEHLLISTASLKEDCLVFPGVILRQPRHCQPQELLSLINHRVFGRICSWDLLWPMPKTRKHLTTVQFCMSRLDHFTDSILNYISRYEIIFNRGSIFWLALLCCIFCRQSAS